MAATGPCRFAHMALQEQRTQQGAGHGNTFLLECPGPVVHRPHGDRGGKRVGCIGVDHPLKRRASGRSRSTWTTTLRILLALAALQVVVVRLLCQHAKWTMHDVGMWDCWSFGCGIALTMVFSCDAKLRSFCTLLVPAFLLVDVPNV